MRINQPATKTVQPQSYAKVQYRSMRHLDRVNSGLALMRTLAAKAREAVKNGDTNLAKKYAREIRRLAKKLAKLLHPPQNANEVKVLQHLNGFVTMSKMAEQGLDTQDPKQADSWFRVIERASFNLRRWIND